MQVYLLEHDYARDFIEKRETFVYKKLTDARVSLRSLYKDAHEQYEGATAVEPHIPIDEEWKYYASIASKNRGRMYDTFVITSKKLL